jgi:hypothetical protein
MTERLREAPRPAVHASPPNPISWRVIGRVLLVATAIGTVLSLFGPFRGLEPFLRRAAEIYAYCWSGSLLGLVCARLLFRLGLGRYGAWAIGIGTGLVMAAPMAAIVWVGNSLAMGRPLPNAELPTMVWDTLLICVAASALGVLTNRRQPMTEASATPPKFLERLPLKLRGGEVWAVEAEDHYLRLHTSKGQDLILMRLSDAVAELEGIEGAQVHRSWWVARDAIADARRGDGRATLTLKDGSQVPVSRTYAAMLRDRNWI